MNLLSGQLIVLKRGKGIKRRENRSDNEKNIKTGEIRSAKKWN